MAFRDPIPVVNADAIGLNKDTSPNELDLRAFSDLLNMRVQDGALERFLGHQPTLQVPPIDPWWLLPVPLPSGFYWIYAGSAKVRAVVGGIDSDITRTVGGDYAAGIGAWTGGVFNGIPVLNNGADVPQYWANPSGGGKLADLPNWQGTVRAKVLRPYKNFLVAANVTKSSVAYPQMVKWSSIADPGSIPSSWNEADPTKEAGEFPLSETPGQIIDMLTMRDANLIYKDDSVYAMTPSGNSNIFRFQRILKEAALLTRNAVKSFNFQGEKHIVFSPDDVFVHDGSTATPILEGRLRKWLFRNIDVTNYVNSFIVMNYQYKEAWICFPMIGSVYANMAIVYNYRTQTLTLRELPNLAYAESGIVLDVAGSGSGGAWQDDPNQWDQDTTAWGDQVFNPGASRIVMAKPGTGRNFFLADISDNFAGTFITTRIERDGLTIVGQDRQGKPIQDSTVQKLLTYIFPRIETDSAVQLNFYVGTQDNRQDPISWEGPFVFDPMNDRHVNPLVSGKILSIRIEAVNAGHFKFNGYDIDVKNVGGL